MLTNEGIRRAIVRSGLCYWEVAQAYGCAESTFSRKLRHELSDDDKTRIHKIIAQLTKERDEIA